MDVEEAKELLTGLRQRFDAPYSESDKSLIMRLYLAVLGKEFKPTSCQTCYHDAVIELYLHLKKYNKMATTHKYSMRAGFIINCPTFHNGTVYTNANITDDIAEEYIKQFPQNRSLFDYKPDVKSGKASSKSGKSGKSGKTTDAGKTAEEADSEAVADAKPEDGSDTKDGDK